MWAIKDGYTSIMTGKGPDAEGVRDMSEVPRAGEGATDKNCW